MIRRRFYNIHMCCWCFDFFFFFFFVRSSDLVILYTYILFCSIIIQKFEWGYTIKYPIKFCIFFYNLMRDLCMRTKKQRFFILKYTHTIESFFLYIFYICFFISFFIIIIIVETGETVFIISWERAKESTTGESKKRLLSKRVREREGVKNGR